MSYNKKQSKEYRQKNLAYRKAYDKKYQKSPEGKERSLKYNKTSKGIYHILKKNSKKKNIKLNISQKEFMRWYDAEKKCCHYCQIPLNKLSLLPKFNRAKNYRFSIDRKDNNLAYQKSNIVLCCMICNSVKSNILSYKEMILIGKTIIKAKWKKLV